MEPKTLTFESTPQLRREEKKEFAVVIGKYLRKIRETKNIS